MPATALRLHCMRAAISAILMSSLLRRSMILSISVSEKAQPCRAIAASLNSIRMLIAAITIVLIFPAENSSHLHIAIKQVVVNSEQCLNRVRGESEAMRFQLFVTISLLLSVLAAEELQGQVNDSSSANHVFAQFADGR